MSDEPRLPAGIPTVRVVAMPRDTNGLGDIFGGWLMSHADLAGSVIALRRAGGRVVTVAVDDFVFLKPVYVSDLVTFYCRLIKVGTTSLQVGIDIFAERAGREGHVKVATALITYVHIGDDRRPLPVPDADS